MIEGVNRFLVECGYSTSANELNVVIVDHGLGVAVVGPHFVLLDEHGAQIFLTDNRNALLARLDAETVIRNKYLLDRS